MSYGIVCYVKVCVWMVCDLQSTHVQAVKYLNLNKRLQSNTAWQSICYAKAVTYVNPMHTQDIGSNTITYPMLCPMLCA